jgi:hypothetical protein
LGLFKSRNLLSNKYSGVNARAARTTVLKMAVNDYLVRIHSETNMAPIMITPEVVEVARKNLLLGAP